MHFMIAQALMKYGETAAETYQCANHICAAVHLIQEHESCRDTYRQALLKAASMASLSEAKPTALRYYQTCISLLQPDAWTDGPDVDYIQTRELYIQTADMLYLLGKYDEVFETLESIFEHGRTPICKTRAWLLKSRVHFQKGDHENALELLCISFEQLGMTVRRDRSWEECDEMYVKLADRLSAIDLDSVLSRPLSEDSKIVAMGPAIQEAMVICFFGEPRSFFSLAIELMHKYIYGDPFAQITPLAIYLAAIALGRFRNVELGFRLGDMALLSMSRDYDSTVTLCGEASYHEFVNHLREPISTMLIRLDMTMERAYMNDDQYAILYNISSMVFARFCLGHDLAEIVALCNTATESIPTWASDRRSGFFIMTIR